MSTLNRWGVVTVGAAGVTTPWFVIEPTQTEEPETFTAEMS